MLDKTDKYIKMMIHAEEIRNGHEFKRGDLYYNPIKRKHIIVEGLDFEMTYPRSRKYWIWLPAQDQLQDMITNKGYFRFSLIELFYRFCMNMTDIPRFTSMEQLWLAFVMDKMFNKVWTHNNIWESI